MAKVKGSVQYSMMVVPYRPGLLWLKRFLALALVAVLMGAAFWYGNHQARQQGLTADQAVYLRNEVTRLTGALSDNQQQLTQARMNAEVDRKTSEDLRKQLLVRREQIAQLERDVSVYRMMSARSSRNPLGISFGKYTIKSLRSSDNQSLPGQYHLKLVLQKLAEGDDEFSGQLLCNLVGTLNGEEKTFSLSQLAQTPAGGAPLAEKIPVSFKYFENVETDIQLPEGFDPLRLELRVESSATGNPLVVAHELEWVRS